MKFTLAARAEGSRARLGAVTTLHNTFETPIFMPVGTRASVRTQPRSSLLALGAPIILANTYHLMLRPGQDLFTSMGGLHRWMAWPHSVLTDSGGFQIFSLSDSRVIDEHGASFRTATGQQVMLTPERSIEMQRAIGSDIMMVLDQCVPSTCSRQEATAAMHLTHRWAARSLAARAGSPQALFAIVQGACFPELRRQSAAVLTAMDGFDGYAIGGLAVGEGRAEREDTTELVTELLPADRPRYLMGVGTPLDVLEGVHRGVDMFDCVLPTAWAQQGVAFSSRGKIDLRRGSYRLAEDALDPACDCEACRVHSRSYLHHLIRASEPLGWQLLAFHNLRFYLRLMERAREHLRAGTFLPFYREQRELLAATDLDNPVTPPRRKPGRPLERGRFAVHTAAAGFSSIRELGSGEIMHASEPPDEEATRLYIDQSRLLARHLASPASARELVVWDVGLGAAHNAMALLRRLAEHPGHPPVRLVSFERDLDAFLLALSHQKRFWHLRHEAPHRLAQAGEYVRDNVQWTLVRGDVREHLAQQPEADVVFYDPFSAKVDAELWRSEAFAQVWQRLRRPSELFTYSSSTAARAALLGAGFFVASGAPSAGRPETTVALAVEGEAVPAELASHRLLDATWLARWSRSTARHPAGTEAQAAAALDVRVAEHPQFRERDRG